MILQSKHVNMQTKLRRSSKIEMMATKQYLSGSRPTIRVLYVHTHARLFEGGARVPGSQVLVPYYESPYFESPRLLVEYRYLTRCATQIADSFEGFRLPLDWTTAECMIIMGKHLFAYQIIEVLQWYATQTLRHTPLKPIIIL